jgi:hypothetical protein
MELKSSSLWSRLFKPPAAKSQDLNPEETQEWLESLDTVLRESGPQRARYLLDRLAAEVQSKHPVSDRKLELETIFSTARLRQWANQARQAWSSSNVLEIISKLTLAVLAVWAAVLCWNGVSWAFRPHQFLYGDEYNNLSWMFYTTYGKMLHLLPEAFYSDRPVAFVLERLLFDAYGYHYTPQLAWYLVFHFTNLLLGVWVFRRLGVRWPLALAGIGVLGSLWTTAAAATYLGASFDVLCLLFMLCSLLTITGSRPWHWVLSAVFFFLSVRSKEFGIVIPILLTLYLVIRELPVSSWRRVAIDIGKRLWLHYVILAVLGIRYISLLPEARRDLPEGTPYHMAFSFGIFDKGLSYYTALIFAREDSAWAPYAGLTVLALVLFALLRRNWNLLFCLVAYVLTLLPMALLPTQRIAYYDYGPQFFLLLAVCLFVQDLLGLVFRHKQLCAVATICAALCMLGWVTSLRASRYFGDRIHFNWMVREACATSAESLQALHLSPGKGARFYVNSGSEMPWLFSWGPCSYEQEIWRDDTIQCIVGKPEAELRELYAHDPAPDKYWLEYAPSGALRLRTDLVTTAPPARPGYKPSPAR